MSHGKPFTPEQKEKLLENENVLAVYDDYVRYTTKFERIMWKEYHKGKKPKRIFWDAGFDLEMIEILGLPRIERTVAHIRKKYTEDQIEWIDYCAELTNAT